MTIASNTIFVYSSYSVEEEKYHYAIICNNDETAVPVDIYLIITSQICAYNLHEFGGHAHCSPLLSPQLSLQRTIYTLQGNELQKVQFQNLGKHLYK